MLTRTAKWLPALLAIAAIAATMLLHDQVASRREAPPAPGPSHGASGLGGLAPVGAHRALRYLDTLPVRPETGAAEYDREGHFGEAWADVDGNSCNQRDDVLLRDAVSGSARVGTQDGCDHDVLAGAWRDPYTGHMLRLDDLKDQAQAQAVTIDHVVALLEAYQSGAARWPRPVTGGSPVPLLCPLTAVGGAVRGAESVGDLFPAEAGRSSLRHGGVPLVLRGL